MSALYGLAREAFLGGDIQWDADDIRCILIDTEQYVVDIDTHQFLNSIPVGARVATTTQLQSPTTTLGIADADDITVVNVTGVSTEAIVIYTHTGIETTARLIAYIDNVGVSLVPNGGNVTINWDNGLNKIFKL